MSLSLGEKLREAREARGLTISEVAEQTRISPHYLQSIENDDYKPLPGGIFNKGFVKSYAKFVGIDDKQAISDYTRVISEKAPELDEEPKNYRPQVLTDEYERSSSWGTIIIAVVILGLLTAGVIYFVNFYQSAPADVTTNLGNTNGANVNNNVNSNADIVKTPTPPINTNEVKTEFAATSAPIWVSYTVDGKKANKMVQPNEPLVLTGQQSVRFSYYRDFTPDKVKLTVNGKEIAPPTPAKGNYNFEINKSNIAKILETGKFDEVAAQTPPAAR